MSRVRLEGYEIYRLEAPTGRVIGDNNCEYSSLGVVAVCLKVSDGRRTWGYGETCWKGKFRVPAWYIRPMLSQNEMIAVFEREWWPLLQGQSLAAAARKTDLPYLDCAVRMAIWDFRAQLEGVPLYQLLGGKPGNNRVRAYGSILDFPLSEEEAVALAESLVRRGFKTVKVKVGAPDVERDIQRLQAIRRAIGEGIELTADANTIWTCDVAIERLREYERMVIKLGYIEDPLPHTDVEGFARLAKSVNVDVVGHDYSSDPSELRRLLEAGGLKRIRAGKDVEYSLACAELGREFGVPLILGNSMFEFNVHAAVALPNVDRLEFSDLAWNHLMRDPVHFHNGFAIAPEAPGHGLDPNPQVLQEWSHPES